MKLKNLKSFSHNFTHSYVSFENYVEGEFVFKDLKDMAYKAIGDKVSIYWIYPKGKVLPLFNDRVNRSIEYYREWLPKLLKQHELDESAISELRTDIYITRTKRLEVQAYVRDINGREYIKNIYEFADLQPYKGET
jgi:serine protease inhibitor